MHLKFLCLWFALTSSGFCGEIFTLTGTSSPALLSVDENTLAHIGGVDQHTSGSGNNVAFNEDGRLFAISSAGLLEINPLTLAITHQGSGDGFGIAVRNGTIYTLTGTSSPQLLTFDENTFALTGGVDQHVGGSGNDIAFDSTGRLFANTNVGLIEYDPVTLAVIHQASGGGSGITIQNGEIYTLTGTSAPGLLTFDENTLAQTGGVNQHTGGAGDALDFDGAGRLFANSNAGLIQFDPITLAILNQASGGGVGIAVNSSLVPEPSVCLLGAMALCTVVGARRRR